ncbi:MAG TPA: VCBS repeat-containing protein [Pyrinomonadaceae bacterium]|nr:VCBS repeat-containing protein [Pyrinomonadaceae bacterium]
MSTNYGFSFRLAVLIAIFGFGLALAQTTALAQSASFSRSDLPSLGNNHVAVDVNGDAVLDLVGTGLNSVGVMLGNGNGTFRPKVEFRTGGQAQDVAAGDFNGDGRVDLAVSLSDPAISLSLLTGNGDGTFNPPANFENTANADSPAVVATDLDNDGRLDVVLAHSISCFTAPCLVSRSITVMLGLGDGTFQPAFEIEVGTGMSRIAVGDFNRDGIKDLGIAGDSSQLYTLLGVGNGTFLQQPTITLTADTLAVDGTDIDIADLNRDTIEDLVVAIPLNGSRTAVLLGRGDGTFGPPSILTEPNLNVPQYQVIADFNRDGFLDLALALGNGTNGLMEIRPGNGDGTFRAPTRYFVPPAQSSIGGGTIVNGDFNRDGRPDIALPIVGASPALALALNSTGAATVQPAYGSVTANPSAVVSGNSTVITINLVPGAVAPANGFTFTVSSSNSTVLSVPSSVFMSQGTSSVRFNANARNVTSSQSVTVRIRNNQLGRRDVSVTVLPSSTPPPPPALTVSAVTLSPASVVGGNNATGTVTLSAAAPSATVVNLASSSARATVPPSVTIAAGASTGTFTVGTASVTATATATISATLNGVTRSATLTINPASAPPPPPSTDTVNITRAEYDSAKRSLRVEATSTSSSATLQAFVSSTGQLIGTLSNAGGGQYRGELSFSTNPQNITVRSSLGGVATRSVVAK